MSGTDSYYFEALQALDAGEEKEAEKLFQRALKQGTPLVVRRSLEELATRGSGKEREEWLRQLYDAYSDEDALLYVCRQLSADGRYAVLIEKSADVDVATCKNELAYLRCHALWQAEEKGFADAYMRWCLERPYTALHHQLFSQVPESMSTTAIAFRDAYYQRLPSIVAAIPGVLADAANCRPQVMSDAGKILLQDSANLSQNITYLLGLYDTVPQESLFYLYFYLGRLYDKEEHSVEKALSYFKLAMENADDGAKYDNALWYYLNEALKDSIGRAAGELSVYCTRWHDPAYFDDFLDTLSVRLITKHFWARYYEITKILDGYASPEATAKYSYIAGRLIEAGFFVPEGGGTKKVYTALYTKALDSGTDFYYRFLAAYRLNKGAEEVEELLATLRLQDSSEVDAAAEALLLGYAAYGMPERLYNEWLQVGGSIGQDCATSVAAYLQECGDADDSYYYKSLRVASRKLVAAEGQVGRELLQLAYPRDFLSRVEECCEEFGMSEYTLFGLIRCESFFNTQAHSHANALGLTQFIKSTADEVAKKLDYATYDLTDSDTSIRFGAYYLSNLTGRLGNVPLHAIFAYNGGASRVRSWINTVGLVFDNKFVPNDLFLEAVPITETREYGRRVTAAAAMYGLLYYGKSAGQVIEEIMN